MPHVVNGCGTWYYGKKNRTSYQGVCPHCHRSATLTSYDTRLFVTLVFIPVIPLGRKRIVEQCSTCSRHAVIKWSDWQKAREEAQQAAAAYDRRSEDPILAAAALRATVSYRDLESFLPLAQRIEQKLGQHAPTLKLLAGSYALFGRSDDVLRLARQVRDLDDSPEHRELLASVMLDAEQTDDVEPLLDHIIDEKLADRVGLLFQLAQNYQLQGRHDKAIDAFLHCEMVQPEMAKDADFVRLRDASAKRLGTNQIVKPAALIQKARRARGARTFGKWAGVLGAIALAIYLAIAASMGTNRRVFLLNGTGVAYDVTVNGQTYSLNPNGLKSIQVREGDLTLNIHQGPASISTLTVAICTPLLSRPLSKHTFVINPDGAAILVNQTVYYAANNPPPPKETYLGGQTLHHLRGIDHPFEAPPQQITLSSNTSTAERRVLDRFTPPADIEPATMLRSLAGQLGKRQTKAILVNRLRFEPASDALIDMMLDDADPAATADLLGSLRDRRPVDIRLHRAYIQLMDRTGRLAQATAEYDALLAATPDDPDLLYLAAAATPDLTRTQTLCQKACAAAGDSAWAHRSLALRHLANARFDEALRHARAACETHGQEDVFLDTLGHALRGAGDHAGYAKLYEALESRPFPRNVQAMAQVAIGYRLAGDAAASDAAIQRFETQITSVMGPFAMSSVMELKATRYYQPGTLDRYIQAAGQVADEDTQWMAAITAGDVNKCLDRLTQMKATTVHHHLLTYLLAMQKSETSAAAEQLKAAIERLAAQGWEERALAAALAGQPDRPADQLLAMSWDRLDKCIGLLALAAAQPQAATPCFELAGRLNQPGMFPGLFIRSILDAGPASLRPGGRG